MSIRVRDRVRRAYRYVPPYAIPTVPITRCRSKPSNNGEWPKQPQPHIPQTPHPPMPDPSFAPQLSNTPRMCTVSHCREVLPPDYPFLRCERHRIQNRHHSKLKRVRDKENKAAAFQDWTPPDGMNGQEGPPEEEGHSPFAEEEPEEEVKTNYYDQVCNSSFQKASEKHLLTSSNVYFLLGSPGGRDKCPSSCTRFSSNEQRLFN